MRNLYFKPGPIRVAPAGTPEFDPGVTVEAAMTRPVFPYAGRQGNVWDLDQWRLRRVTTRDLDSGSHGAVMNAVMDEWVADARWRFQVTEASGAVALGYELGQQFRADLRLAEGRWQVLVGGAVVGEGACSAQPDIAFGRCDDQVVLRLDGHEVVRSAVPPIDPTRHRPRWSWSGNGAISLRQVVLERDLHYTARGFLANQAADKARGDAILRAGGLDDLQRDRQADQVASIAMVREQMRWSEADRLTAAQRVDRWGYSPETAITAPPGCYLLLGDNSPFSLDSRMWGWVPEENLRGRALAVMFPPQRWRIIR